MTRWALLVLALAAAGCAAPQPGAEPLPDLAPARIEGPFLLDATAPGGEPMLALAPDGSLYLQAISSTARGASTNAAWRSADGGRTWARLDIPAEASEESFDGAIAAGPDGAVYLASAYRTELRLWRSTDAGASWSALAIPPLAATHRMWLAPSEGRLDVGIDTLGGPNLHFALGDAAATPVAPNYDVGGALARREDGLLLWPRHEAAPMDRYVTWRSVDDGATWTSAPMTTGELPETYPAGPARRTSIWTPTVFDADGAAYHAWSASGAVLLSRSLDDGATWSLPIALTREDEVAVMPWMTSDLTLAAYRENGSGWSPLLLRLDWPADADAPSILRAELPGVLHEGALCTFGQGCPPEERALGEFPALATLGDGRVVAVFASSIEATEHLSTPVAYLVPSGAFG